MAELSKEYPEMEEFWTTPTGTVRETGKDEERTPTSVGTFDKAKGKAGDTANPQSKYPKLEV